jgi:hypothetical protein
MLGKFKNNLFIILILIIGLVLALRNYTPGTFLSGWDDLHPEFNFSLGLQREISGVFRPEEGLGTVAAHSHMADLPHLVSIYLLHFAFPTSLLRYLYIFLNLILGPIGMFYFLNKHIVKNKKGAFLGSLFYLLNLGTLQIFVVPFEMFTTQYALLPWIFLFATNYIREQKPSRELLYFAIVILLTTPTAYAATLWYLFFCIFILYLFSLNLLDRSSSIIKKSLVLIILTLTINLFWIMPNIYFVVNHGKDVTNALINQLFSPQAFLYNKEFGNIKDIPLIKNFLFDWNVYSGNNNFSQLLSPWISHLNQKPVMLIGYIFALVALAGILNGVFKKNKILISLAFPLLVCFFFLFNDNFPIASIYNFLQDKIPLFREAFRFPDDKILGVFTFLFAVYFAKGQEVILSKLKFRGSQFVYLLICLSLIIFYMLPAFEGNLISPYMRVQIPKYYFEMFNWFNSQPSDARVAELPVNSFWGWKYYDWYGDKNPSFQGADFLQFGIRQPLLDRDFDRWSPYNEQYYREMSYAIYSKNPSLLRTVLQKYDIRYILLDTGIIAPEDDPKVLFYPEIKNLLSQDNSIREVKSFNNSIFIYEIKSPTQEKIINNPPAVSSKPKANYEDFIYENYGNYIYQKEGFNFPLADFIDNQNKVDPAFVQFQQTGVNLDMQTKQAPFNLPSLTDTESYINAQLLVERNNNKLTVNIYPIMPSGANLAAPISVPVILKPLPVEIVASINQKSNLILNLKDNTPFSMGNAELSTTKINTLAIYSLSSKKTTFSGLSKLNYSLSSCNQAKNQEIFGIEQGLNKNSFYIFGKNNPVCLTIPLEQFLSQISSAEALVGMNFSYESIIPSELCIARNNECIYQPIKYNQSNYAAINRESAGELAIKLFVNTSSEIQTDKALIENFSIDILSPLSETDIPQENIKKAVGDTTANNIQNPLFMIPFSGEKALGTSSIFSDENPTYTTASSSNSTNKQIIKDDSGDYMRYTSTNGSLSDNFAYRNLPQDRAYLIAVTSRNVKGLPLNLCVINEITKHCDIYAALSSFENFSKDVFLLPAQLKDNFGFNVNINNLGIGNDQSINDLKSIEIIPFPYRYLSQVSTGNVSLQKDKNVFVLAESYEEGWEAYEFKNVNWLDTVFPFLFGAELKEHVLVNNWENGWILSSGSNNSEIVTIFWPQYLEYLGFGILAGSFIWLFCKKKN